jgi:hypothetical protein
MPIYLKGNKLYNSGQPNTGGPFITGRYNEVNSIIQSLSPGEGYSLTPIDLQTVYAKYYPKLFKVIHKS